MITSNNRMTISHTSQMMTKMKIKSKNIKVKKITTKITTKKINKPSLKMMTTHAT